MYKISNTQCLLASFFDVAQIITIETPYQVKEEEDNAMHSTVVIFSSNDNFTLKQVQFCCTTAKILLEMGEKKAD